MSGDKGFSYGGGASVDDQIVNEALGKSSVVDVEGETLPQGKNKKSAQPMSKKKKMQQVAMLSLGALVLGGGGAYFAVNDGSHTPIMSPELAGLVTKSIGGQVPPPAPVIAPVAPVPDAVPAPQASAQAPDAAAAPTPAPVSVSAGDSAATIAASSAPPVSAAAPVANPAVSPSAQPLTAQPQGVAPVLPPAVGAAPVANVDVATLDRQIADRQAVLSELDRQVATKETRLVELTDLISAQQEKLAGVTKAAEKQAAQTKVAPIAKAPVEKAVAPAAPKQAQAKAPGVNKVFAILADAVILSDGDVVRVGETIPRTSTRLTMVNPATNTIALDGVSRHVQVEER